MHDLDSRADIITAPRSEILAYFDPASGLFRPVPADARNQDVNREVALGKIAANRQVEIARIEGGMVDVKKSNPDG